MKENEIILGLNYRDFCSNNNIIYCDGTYINTLLVNKKINDFPFYIKDVFDNEETAVLSNERFLKLYEDNEYEEYYFDIKKEDTEKMFEIINNEELLMCFDFILIGESEGYLRYRVDVNDYKYFKGVDYDKYIVCLEKGYNCLDYINKFNSLIKIGDFEEIELLDFKIINETLNDKEIVISSLLSESINKKKGEVIPFYFKYNGKVKIVEFCIKDVINEEKYFLYQNSEWSINLFKNVLEFNESDLRIKNIVVYEDVNKGDYESDDLYKSAIEDLKNMIMSMKKKILFVTVFISVISMGVLIFLEIYQNKFKKQYFSYLRLLGVNKKGT